MGSVGRFVSSRTRARTQAFAAVGASEGFAAGRVVWICALWALIHSVLASKQAKDFTRRIAGSRYRDGLYRLASTLSRSYRSCGRRCVSRACPTESSTA